MNGISSQQLPIKAGVPQGSILGPILFLVYVNDIANELMTDTSLFADDATLMDVFDDPVQYDNRLNNDLLKIELWAKRWVVDFNPTKTVYMIFTSKQTELDQAELTFFNTTISRVEWHKNLGITFHFRMTWHNHINNIIKSCLKRINFLKSVKWRLPRDTLETQRPIIEYGCVVFYEEGSDLAMKLEQIQYKAGILVTGALKNSSHDKILCELGWQPLSARVNFSCIPLKAGDPLSRFLLATALR